LENLNNIGASKETGCSETTTLKEKKQQMSCSVPESVVREQCVSGVSRGVKDEEHKLARLGIPW